MEKYDEKYRKENYFRSINIYILFKLVSVINIGML